MKKTRALVATVTAGAMVLSMAACGSSAYQETTAAAATEAAGTAAAGETAAAAEATGTVSSSDLKVMLETPVMSLDPQQATDGTSFEVMANYTDGLTQMDASGAAVAAIAESWETSDDGLTWTFHLRKDAKWSNGTPVTAKDFVFGWQRAVDPDVASEYAYMLSDIGQVKNAAEIIDGTKDKSELGVTAVDDNTLQVELNAPVSYFLSLMYFPTFYPVNEEFFNTCPDTYGTSPATTLSNGAFVLDSYEPAATEIHLTKNADYYDADKIKLAGIDYQVIQDSQQALLSYQSGDLDLTLLNGDQVDQVQDDLQMLFDKQYILTETVTTETRYRTETEIAQRPMRDPKTGKVLLDKKGQPIMEDYEVEIEVPYTYTICTVTLKNRNLSHIPVEILGEDGLSMYAAYMATLGNREDLFPNSPYVGKYSETPPKYEIPSEVLADETFSALITEAEKYIGMPYVWGGSNPNTSFDCSGFICWSMRNSGVWNVGRTSAQGLCNLCTPVAKSNAQPGDLIFFKGTYDTPCISHVGLYVGAGKMLHCGDPIRYVDINTTYWQAHFYAFARPPYQ